MVLAQCTKRPSRMAAGPRSCWVQQERVFSGPPHMFFHHGLFPAVPSLQYPLARGIQAFPCRCPPPTPIVPRRQAETQSVPAGHLA
eukprot:07828_6